MSRLHEGPPFEDAMEATTRPEPVDFRSKHDVTLVVQALQKEATNLTAKGKKLVDEKYPRQAKVLMDDAAAIEHAILPALRGQMAMDLTTPDQLEAAIRSALRRDIYRAFDQLDDPKVLATPDALVFRRNQLIEAISRKVMVYAIDLAGAAFGQGLAARLSTSEALALRALESLRDGDDS